jgi:hypothetical protein
MEDRHQQQDYVGILVCGCPGPAATCVPAKCPADTLLCCCCRGHRYNEPPRYQATLVLDRTLVRPGEKLAITGGWSAHAWHQQCSEVR